jgi:DNA adenine methylase
MMTPKRPLLRYHGGKWKLAPWIISHFPAHRTYVEPYGGAGSVLLRKPPSYAEIYNELDGEIDNLFQVLRNPAGARELLRQIKLTPYSDTQFNQSWIAADDPIEQARRTVFRFAAGVSPAGSAGAARWKTGFRDNISHNRGTTPADDWRSYPQALEAIIDRLQGVIIRSLPALEAIERYTGADTLFYVDPPYPYGTRNERWAGQCYNHEMADDDHRALAEALHQAAGFVVLSGYACELYDVELYPDWQRIDRDTHSDSAGKRIESLWLSPRTTEALQAGSVNNGLPLFAALP